MLDLQQDARQHLADLVVQLTGDPAPLVLLRRHRAHRARPSLELESLEHAIERVGEHVDLRVRPAGRGPDAGTQEVDPAHVLGEAFQRRERTAHQGEVEDQHHAEARHDDERLADGDRRAHRRRAEEQDRARAEQHHGVDGEDPPHQRESTARRSGGDSTHERGYTRDAHRTTPGAAHRTSGPTTTTGQPSPRASSSETLPVRTVRSAPPPR